MRAGALWLCAVALALAAGGAALRPAAAQPDSTQVFLPLLSADCSGAAICASIVVGPGEICCMGGLPGSQIEVPVTVLARSSAGQPLEMISDRASCSQTGPIADATWEPHVAHQLIPVTLPVNWSTFSWRVQLRDAAGNLSPILCDDVALEGYFPPTGARP